jgi:predicted RecB family nuclease
MVAADAKPPKDCHQFAQIYVRRALEFDRWVTTRDVEVRQRILDYNEDDCRATRVLLDGIRGLAAGGNAP